MFKKILVPLDGSPLAEAVLAYVTLIANGYGSTLTLAYVISPERLEVSQHYQRYLGELARRAETAAGDYLSTVAERLRAVQASVEQVVLHGGVAQTLVYYAEREGVDLIAISTNGRTGLGMWMSGSVTDRILHTSPVPMLVIRPDTYHDGSEVKLTKVVVPLDGSALAESILPLATDVARHLGLEVVLVQAVQTTSALFVGREDFAYPQDLVAEIEGAANAYLENIARRWCRDGLRSTVQVIQGRPAAAITDFARGIPDNLVAMSTHGHSGPESTLLGSVADRVIRGSGEPVLAVRPKQT